MNWEKQETLKTNKVLKKIGINHRLMTDDPSHTKKTKEHQIFSTTKEIKIKHKNKIIFYKKNKNWTDITLKISPCEQFVAIECEIQNTDISLIFVYDLFNEKTVFKSKNAFVSFTFMSDSRFALAYSLSKGIQKKYSGSSVLVYDFVNKKKTNVFTEKPFKNIAWVSKFKNGLLVLILDTNKQRIIFFDHDLKIKKEEKVKSMGDTTITKNKILVIRKTKRYPFGILKDFLSGSTLQEIKDHVVYLLSGDDGDSGFYALGMYDKNLNQKVVVFNDNHKQIKSLKVDKYSEITNISFEKNKLSIWLMTPFGDKNIIYNFKTKKISSNKYFFKGYKNIEVSHKIINNSPVIFYKKKGTILYNQKTLAYVYGGFEDTCFISIEKYAPYILSGKLFVNIWPSGNSHEPLFWNKIGTSQQNKQKSVSETISVIKNLIKRKISDKNNISILGFSNGGFMVGAILNKSPELFSSAISSVGVMDLLKYQNFTGGAVWSQEYGNQTQNVSPLHNIKPNNYPPILIQSGKFDSRVVPYHQISYAKKIKENTLNPVYFEQMNSGHARSSDSWKSILRFILIHEK